MAFREHLQEISAAVEGAFACSVMGYDGIPVDTVEKHSTDLDIAALLVEYSTILNHVRVAAAALQTGHVQELVVATDRITAMSRPLGAEYFLLLALTRDANWGKARYVMRVVAPKVEAEL